MLPEPLYGTDTVSPCMTGLPRLLVPYTGLVPAMFPARMRAALVGSSIAGIERVPAAVDTVTVPRLAPPSSLIVCSAPVWSRAVNVPSRFCVPFTWASAGSVGFGFAVACATWSRNFCNLSRRDCSAFVTLPSSAFL